MRIIAGTLRGRGLHGPEPGDRSIRPTSDMAREALFSILQRWPSGAFLDLFAGTGAVAMEAWSRGYEPVVCVEKAPAALKLVEANARGTGVRVVKRDAARLRPGTFPGQAVVFVDPPYDLSPALWPALAPGFAECLLPGGILVWETDRRVDLPAVPGLAFQESRTYGAARFHFFQR